jgi:hypothetical protein
MSAQLHQLAVVLQPSGAASPVISSVDDFDPSSVDIRTTEREVIFSHGTEMCSVGTIDLASSLEQEDRNFVGNKLALSGIPRLLTQICDCEASDLSRVPGGITSLEVEKANVVNQLLERMERLVSHILGSDEVSDALKVVAPLFEWIDADDSTSYFEHRCPVQIAEALSSVEAACAIVYSGPAKVTFIFHEQAFYITIADAGAEGEQSISSTTVPDISRR